MRYEPTYIIGDMLAGEQAFIEQILSVSPVREYDAGHILLFQGNPFRNLYLVLDGIIECSFYSEQGQKKINSLHIGRWFFGISALDGNQHTMTYTCLTKVHAAQVQPEALQNWDKYMLLTLAKLQKQKERYFDRQLQMRAYYTADERVMCVLKDLSYANENRPKDGYLLTGIITHQMIGELIGSTRVQVSNILKKWVDMGKIKVHNKKIYIRVE